MSSNDNRCKRGPIDLSAEEFRAAGHQLVDQIADFFESLPDRPITPNTSPGTIREIIGSGGLPRHGKSVNTLLNEVAPLLFDHSLHNGSPNFYGYISSSGAPLGALSDLLAAAVNANVGKWDLSPIASEIEAQTIRWLAELIGYDPRCGGLMVSGGNMANFVAFVAARCAKSPWNIREKGVAGDTRRLTAYCSRETHTWIQKAADVTGIGTEALRWIATDNEQRLLPDALREQIERDTADDCVPFIVIGTAGSVSTGAVDGLPVLHEIAKTCGAWFHVDGAYGAPAAVLEEADEQLLGLQLADSVALDPHKWLYSPIEAACTLVRDRQHLLDAFSYRPPYYRIDDDADDNANDYFELGMQNSRGFRALKVWLSLRHLGREGYERLIREDIELAAQLHAAAGAHDEIEAFTCNLSITTFRFVPIDLQPARVANTDYLNELNEALVEQLQLGGDVYVSNAIIDGTYLLRACIVNFRTTAEDVAALPEKIARVGRRLDVSMRSGQRENRQV